MVRRFLIALVALAALSGCATYGTSRGYGYGDGDYYHGGASDYYYGRPYGSLSRSGGSWYGGVGYGYPYVGGYGGSERQSG